MHWLVQSVLGLRWVIPMVTAWSHGGADCEMVWVHDTKEGVSVGTSFESRGEILDDEDYYDIPAAVCRGDQYILCTNWECVKW